MHFSPFLLTVAAVALGGCAVVKAGGNLVGETVGAAATLSATILVTTVSTTARTTVALAEAGGQVAYAAGGVVLGVTGVAAELSYRGAVVLGHGVLDVTPVVLAYAVEHPDRLLQAMAGAGFPPAAIGAVAIAIRAQRTDDEFRTVVRHATAGSEPFRAMARATAQGVTSSYWTDARLPGEAASLDFREQDGHGILVMTVDAPAAPVD